MNNNIMIKIGITGSIGMGKSTVSKMFRLIGIPVFDSDYEVNQLLNHDDKTHEKIKNVWPNAFDDKTKTVNREILRKIIFAKNTEKKGWKIFYTH